MSGVTRMAIKFSIAAFRLVMLQSLQSLWRKQNFPEMLVKGDVASRDVSRHVLLVPHTKFPVQYRHRRRDTKADRNTDTEVY
jgi:hypothetical protein